MPWIFDPGPSAIPHTRRAAMTTKEGPGRRERIDSSGDSGGFSTGSISPFSSFLLRPVSSYKIDSKQLIAKVKQKLTSWLVIGSTLMT